MPNVSQFNPLAFLDPESPDFNEQVDAIADGIIVINPFAVLDPPPVESPDITRATVRADFNQCGSK